jgi:hypothetical protein
VHPGLEQPLHRVVDGGEDAVAGEGEDDRVGVQRPQPAEGEPRLVHERQGLGVQAQRRQHQLQGHDDPHQHAHDAPEDRRPREQADDAVVVLERLQLLSTRPG